MNNTKPHNDYESKNSNWLLQLENKWVYAHYNSIKHKKNCGFIPQSSGGQDAYDSLDMVHEGGDAMSIYQKLANAEDLETISRYKSSLIEYCKLDTLAMVKILEKLRQIN